MGLDFLVRLIEEQSNSTLFVWLIVLNIVMYVIREPVHQIILFLFGRVRNILRLISHYVKQAEKKLTSRNRHILLMQGRVQYEQLIAQEFQQIESLIHRNLDGYPLLQKDLRDQISRIDEDYIHSNDALPQPPEWLKAVEAVAEIPDNGSPAVAKILADIHNTLKQTLDTNLHEYRRTNQDRHNVLKKMLPYWRALTKTLGVVEKNISELEHRTYIIDNKITVYENIVKNTDSAEQLLAESSITRFFVSGLLLCLALVGMAINFQLIVLPMEEMVGASSYLGSSEFLASEVSALFIVSIEIILGLLLLESIGITHLFPSLHLLEIYKRKIIFWIAFIFLFIFASIEVSLAYMSDVLISDRESMSILLAGIEVIEPELSWIPHIGQMVMAFILPFVLVFVIIPLEIFIHAFRILFGLVIVSLLGLLRLLIRISSNIIYELGRLLINIYDFIILVPLKIERRMNEVLQTRNIKNLDLNTVNHRASTNFDELLQSKKSFQVNKIAAQYKNNINN